MTTTTELATILNTIMQELFEVIAKAGPPPLSQLAMHANMPAHALGGHRNTIGLRTGL